MKPSTVLALTPFLAAAYAKPVEKQPSRFDVMAVSEGPVQYRALALSSSFFYLGKGDGFTDSFCPPKVEEAGKCPPGKDTVFKDASTLDTVVPGQVLYVDFNYAVRATGPNGTEMEADGSHTKPDGIYTGFEYVPGSKHGQWEFHAHGSDGFLACPYGNDIYQVYVNSPNAKPPRGQDLGTCVLFNAGAFEYSLPANATAAAWRY
ncbi:hypothetical protein ASPVEDRAFT_78456 [Aspergillus versicolor CBS 583.65]|uniref:IgE-binding protein n=1 Tax=Aspergillus versicolor CBS 583.65 TaxID=1036611 RepID=A0A1L9P5B8_ASPVE|nr:uncharacterized protein ASPVEDRAFT_78456 [Aspergillus versicolor CBS 583.65]OJI96698.1 hypothetical protein ASPVEDRAFT_78456 [Aspergillus versicolor CBS 583.65]